jgi:MarR family transcriptional regulator, organic hydroperoxide resistance regulator
MVTSAAGPRSREREPLPPLGVVLEFMRLIWAVDRGFGDASQQVVASLGVTAPQHLVMRIVGRFPGISAGQLARMLHARPSTLTPVLKHLERRGLLARRADPRDSRRAALGLTERGWRLDDKAGGAAEEAIRQALSALARKDVRAARSVLAAVAEALETR